jgi:hypothetical protein
MSTRRILLIAAAALALLVLAAHWSMAHAQAADSTICVSFRTRTTSTGKIATTSVTKVTCGSGATRDTVIVTRVDTLKPTPAPVPLDPRGYNCWTARDAANPTCITDDKAPTLSQTLVLRSYGMTFGFQRWMWHGVIYPSDPSLTPAGRVDTVIVKVPVPGPVVHDTVPVIVIRVDTLYRPAPTPTPSTGAPELPRGMAAMDSMLADGARAAAMTVFRDTIYTTVATDGLPEARCKGLDCTTPEMVQRLKDYTAELRKNRLNRAVPRKKVVPPTRKEPVG